MLFCSTTSPALRDVQEALSHLPEQVKGIELRFDGWDQIHVEEVAEFVSRLRRGRPLKLLFTLRPLRQGGQFQGDEETRLNLLKKLCELKPDYLDLEHDVPLKSWKEFAETFPQIQLICSYHDLNKMPEDLDSVLSSIQNSYAHFYKVAVMPDRSVDALRMIEWIRKSEKPLIGVAMGEVAKFSRFLGPVAGNRIDYASLFQPTAAGQLSWGEMDKPYRYSQLNRETALLGLIGSPVEKSLGHLIHNAVFEHNRTNAVYVKMEVMPAELSSLIEVARRLPFKGLSVTMPLKEAIIPFLDELTFEAEAMEAVNTVAVEQGRWIGHNTDGMGALDAIEKRVSVSGKHLVVIGAGGAAKAVIYEAIKRGAEVTIINRTASKAGHLSQTFRCRGGGFSLFSSVMEQGYDILINTTPEGELMEEKWLIPETLVMDLVYVPKMTPFLSRASQRNCQLVYGYEMFIGQAIRQQQIWYSEQKSSVLHQVMEPIVLR